MYRVLYNRTDGENQRIVAGCEESLDGIEAYRMLVAHCDPYIFNTAATMMESITKLGKMKPNNTEDLLSILREIKKRLEAYEDRLKPLEDARTTWIPAMAIELMTEDELTFIRRSDASEDFEKMIKTIEELRNIKKSVNKKGNLRAMREEEDPEEEPDEECEEDFDRWAQDPSVSKEQLLAAIGKGSGKGGKFRFREKGGGKGNGPKTGKPAQPSPSAPTGARIETRSRYN